MTHTEIAAAIPDVMMSPREGLRRVLQECLTSILHLDTITTRLNFTQYRKQTLSRS